MNFIECFNSDSILELDNKIREFLDTPSASGRVVNPLNISHNLCKVTENDFLYTAFLIYEFK